MKHTFGRNVFFSLGAIEDRSERADLCARLFHFGEDPAAELLAHKKVWKFSTLKLPLRRRSNLWLCWKKVCESVMMSAGGKYGSEARVNLARFTAAEIEKCKCRARCN